MLNRIVRPNELRKEIKSVDEITSAQETRERHLVRIFLADGKTYLVDMNTTRIEAEFNPGDVEARIIALLKKKA